MFVINLVALEGTKKARLPPRDFDPRLLSAWLVVADSEIVGEVARAMHERVEVAVEPSVAPAFRSARAAPRRGGFEARRDRSTRSLRRLAGPDRCRRATAIP